MTKPDFLENQVKKNIFIGIGSNLGNKKHNIETAKFLLQSNGVVIRNCSPKVLPAISLRVEVARPISRRDSLTSAIWASNTGNDCRDGTH